MCVCGGGGGGGGRERERETDRQAERQTETERDTQRERERERERERDVCVTIEMCVVKVQCVCEQVARGEPRFHSIMYSLNDEANHVTISLHGSPLPTLNYNTHNHVQHTIATYAPPKVPGLAHDRLVQARW